MKKKTESKGLVQTETVTAPAKPKVNKTVKTCGNCGNHDHLTGDCYLDPITIKSSFTFGVDHRACAQWVKE